MTDTAVPLPELPDYTESADDQVLTLDQLRRIEALKVARSILENKPGLFAGSKVEANRAVYDLTFLADWIIDGPDNNDDTVDLVNGAGETVSVSSKPGVWRDIDTGSHDSTGGYPPEDAAADDDLPTAADGGN
jgi:hypothetical protein